MPVSGIHRQPDSLGRSSRQAGLLRRDSYHTQIVLLSTVVTSRAILALRAQIEGLFVSSLKAWGRVKGGFAVLAGVRRVRDWRLLVPC
jgi:hypothetical protein